TAAQHFRLSPRGGRLLASGAVSDTDLKPTANARRRQRPRTDCGIGLGLRPQGASAARTRSMSASAVAFSATGINDDLMLLRAIAAISSRPRLSALATAR